MEGKEAGATLENIIRIGYCDIFNLRLLNFFWGVTEQHPPSKREEPALPATRVHLTVRLRLNTEEPSTRCSFTTIGISSPIIDLDPRSPIPITIIFNDVTIPSVRPDKKFLIFSY